MEKGALLDIVKVVIPALLSMWGMHTYDMSYSDGKNVALESVIEVYSKELTECQTRGIENG